MEGEHTQEMNVVNAQINQMRIDHEVSIHNLEANYNEKLIIEYNKYVKFESKMDNILKEAENNYNELKKARKESEKSIIKKYEEQLKEKDSNYEEVS